MHLSRQVQPLDDDVRTSHLITITKGSFIVMSVMSIYFTCLLFGLV